MTVNIIKLCVGADSIADLERWQKQRWKEAKELMHVTRNTPKRAEEVLNGGSLYWIINGHIAARQRILELRQVMKAGIPSCGLVYDKELIRVMPRPHRAFQGWRYFDPKDAPKDLPKGKGIDEMPEALVRELTELGLI